MMLGGKDRGKKGKVLSLFPRENKLVVEGLNMIKRHTKARQQGQHGQIISKERLVSVASIGLICKACGKVTRVGYRIDSSTGTSSEPQSNSSGQVGRKVRICKKCGAET